MRHARAHGNHKITRSSESISIESTRSSLVCGRSDGNIKAACSHTARVDLIALRMRGSGVVDERVQRTRDNGVLDGTGLRRFAEKLIAGVAGRRGWET